MTRLTVRVLVTAVTVAAALLTVSCGSHQDPVQACEQAGKAYIDKLYAQDPTLSNMPSNHEIQACSSLTGADKTKAYQDLVGYAASLVLTSQ